MRKKFIPRGSKHTYFRIVKSGRAYRDDYEKKYPFTPLYDRDSPMYRDWRLAVLIRDNSRCVLCSSYQYVHCHHIASWENTQSLRYDEKNGVTLCKKCHDKYHSYKALPFPKYITERLKEYLNSYYSKRREEMLAKWTVKNVKSIKKLKELES